jgi:signal transduction histidine kinase
MAVPIPTLRPIPEQIGRSDFDADSQMLAVADSAVLVLCRPGEATHAVSRALLARDFLALEAPDVDATRALGFSPRFAVVETALPGALDHVRRTLDVEGPRFAIALLDASESEGPALRAGCALALRMPCNPDDVVFALERMRRTYERWAAARETLERDRTTVSVPVVEAVVSALQHELRNPLAAALSNVECLHEELAPRDERRALTHEIQGSLRRMAKLLDVVSSLVDGRPIQTRRIVLCDVVGRAIASAGTHCNVLLGGDRDVLGWGNADLLESVVATLVQYAGQAKPELGAAKISVRVYSTKTEARISIRGDMPSGSQPASARSFEPVIQLGGDAKSGLTLPLVRHAITRMGGTITLSNDAHGRVFRIRLSRG